jgi:uncharacterized membrane protein YfcA
MQWYVYLFAILAGGLAGVINTLAGSGSLVTLPMLVFLGLPADVANGTNRIGVLLQNVVGIFVFGRSESFEPTGNWWLITPSVAGALLGAWIATVLDKSAMEMAIGIVMVVMLVVLISNPKRWLREHSEVATGRPGWAMLVLFFGIGIYGGFIQAGVGVLLLSALVLASGYTLNHANMIKLVVVLLMALTAIPFFMLNNQIDWGLGALMAVGQGIGAWLAANYATRVPNANVWVRRLLIVIVLVSIARFLLF